MNKNAPNSIGESDHALVRSFYQHLADSAAECSPPIFLTDPEDDFRLVFASRACRDFGNPFVIPQDIRLPEFIPTLTQHKLQQFWEHVSLTGKYFTEAEYRLESGARIAVEIVFELFESEERLLMSGFLRDISDRRALEAERLRLASDISRQETELRYREIFENVTDGISLLDVDGERIRFATVNPAFARIIGVVPMEMIGRGVEESLPESTAKMLMSKYRSCVENRKPLQYETELDLPAGRKTLDTTLVPVQDGLGRIHRIIELTSDVTQSKKAERENSFMAYALDHMQDAVFLHDSKFRLTYVNELACQSLGYSREELLSMTVMDIDPCVDQLVIDELHAQAKANGHVALESFHKTKDDRLFPVEVRSSVFEYGGEMQWLAVVRDITQRKRAEAEKQQLIEILEQSADFIGSADMEGNLLYHNHAARRMVGLPEDGEMSGMRISDMHPEWALNIVQNTALPHLLAQGIWRGETALLHRDGREIPVSQLLVLHRDANGKPLYHSTIMTDITERKRIENTLKFIAQRGWHEGGESFLTALARHLGQMMQVDYVIIDKLADETGFAETVAIYARGQVLPNMRYSLSGTPCNNVMDGIMCCYPGNVQQLFPTDYLLVEMAVESYVGLPLMDSSGKVIGLIAVMDGKPLQDSAIVTSLLQVVGSRAAAELEREQSERALEDSWNFLNRVIDTIADPVFVKDREHRWIRLNRAFCDFIGQPMESLLGKSDYDFFPGHEADIFWAKDEEVFNNGMEDVNEEEFTDSNGLTHTIITKKTCYTDERGQQFLVGTILDITKRKQYELSLLKRAQLEEQLSALADSVPGFVYTMHIDEEGTISFPFVSAGIKDLFGLDIEDVRNNGLALRERYHPEDLRRVLPRMDESRRNLTPFRIEIRIAHPERGQRWIEIRSTPYRQADGSTEWHGLMIDVTERKQAQNRLEHTQQRLRSVLQTIPDYVWLKNIDGVFLACNPAFERLYGAEEANIIGKTDYDFVDAELADFFRQKDREALQAGRVIVNEEWVVNAENNAHVMLETRKVPVYDTNGQILGVLGIARDVTEKKLREEQLMFLDYALDHVDEALYLVDDTARFVKVNAEACRMLGYTKDELIKLRVFDIDPDFDEAQWRSRWSHGLRRTIETRHQRKDGTVFPVEISINYIAHQGQYYDFAMARDITDRKRAEMLLYQSERQFRTLVENLPVYVMRLNRELRRIYVNPAYVKAINIPEGELLGKDVASFWREGNNWRATNMSVEEYIALLHRVMESGVEEEISPEWVDDDGFMVCHMLRISPEFGAQGEITGLLVIGFDITEGRREQMLEAKRQHVFELMAQDEVLHQTLEQISHYVEAAHTGVRCCILLSSGDDDGKLTRAAAPSLPTICPGSGEICTENACRGLTAWQEQNLVVTDINQGEHPQSILDFARENRVATSWSMPIKSPSGHMLGVTTFYLNQPGQPDPNGLKLLQQACHLSSIAIERKRIEEQMQHQASYDMLTDLPNRRLFANRLADELAKAARNGYTLALLFIDLDHFKEINDTLGHHIGDSLLVEAARRIQKCVRVSDIVARLGGDEFVVIIPDYADIGQLGRMAHQIIEAMSVPFQLNDHEAYISASIGIACYPDDADTMEVLVSRADQAMYAAKAQGRNCFGFFTPTMQQQAQHRMRLMLDLRHALNEGQMDVHYQPIVDVATGRVVKAEALVRWHHPVLGAIRPDEFIPMAEEAGVIHDIGDWIFRQSAAMVVRWKQNRAAKDCAIPCQMSVNISPRQFSKGNADEAWIEYLQHIGLDPACMAIEITEGLLLDDRSDVTRRLSRFREVGMGVSLDDFGTGYSAMAYLKKFNIDYLKIDRSFVRDLVNDPNDRAIAEAIIVMAHKLGLKTIAEGVETAEQRDLLADAGCEYIQGYLYAKPMPGEEFLAFIDGIDAQVPKQ